MRPFHPGFAAHRDSIGVLAAFLVWKINFDLKVSEDVVTPTKV